MPEDQGVNGDAWNDQAAVLLRKFNWIQIGDANIDVTNVQGKKHGLDRMFKYSDGRRGGKDEGVIIEAKRYKTTSFQKDYLQSWIKILDKKINNLKYSEDFQTTYPDFSSITLRIGIIAIWFSDCEEYIRYKSIFKDSFTKIKLPQSKVASSNRIYVLENDQILKLASLATSIDDYNNKHKTELLFYYPTSDKYDNPVSRTNILTVENIFSQFILAECVSEGVENKVVFYFGELTISCFKRLKSALQGYLYIDEDKPLILYLYERSDEYRKIEPEVTKLFSNINFKTVQMNKFSDLPGFLND